MGMPAVSPQPIGFDRQTNLQENVRSSQLRRMQAETPERENFVSVILVNMATWVASPMLVLATENTAQIKGRRPGQSRTARCLLPRHDGLVVRVWEYRR